MVDKEDSSLTRCNAYMLDLFERAGMQVSSERCRAEARSQGRICDGASVCGCFACCRNAGGNCLQTRATTPPGRSAPIRIESFGDTSRSAYTLAKRVLYIQRRDAMQFSLMSFVVVNCGTLVAAVGVQREAA